tara:strand:+ start:2577 stop:2900 length:324 start_codon:yes stop_codon:yes gene_type:complete
MMKQKKKWKMSYQAKERLQAAGLITLITGAITLPIAIAYVTQADYKYVEGDHVTMVVGDDVGEIIDSKYANSGSVPRYTIRVILKDGTFTEFDFHETQIKGLVKKIN